LYYHRVDYVDPNLAVLLIPKVAQTSIDALLATQRGYSRENIDKAELPSNLFYATFVRHPYDRIFSVYRDKIMKQNTHFHPTIQIRQYGFVKRESFDAFVRKLNTIPKERDDRHFRSQVDLLKFAPKLDFVGYYETLATDWQDLAKRFNLPKQLVHKNPGKKVNLQLTDELREILYNRYKEDFDRFGYEP